MLVDFLGLEVFPNLGYPHELSIEIVIIVFHKNSGCQESCVDYIPSDLGNEPWMDRDHMFNQDHVHMSGLRGLPDQPAEAFYFGPIWPLVGLLK